MLEPRETDIPALFLFLVVLPLVAYFLLGRWSEVSKKKERASLLAQCAAEEAFRVESMTAATLFPLAPLTKIGVHECARCYAPSTTRCSRCKSVRYCSGKCQIIHWRQVHKHECQQLEYSSSNSSPKSVLNEKSIHERVLFDDNMNSQCSEYNKRQARNENTHDDDMIQPPPPVNATFLESAACAEMDTSEPHLMERRSADKRVSRKSNREMLRREDGAILESSDDAFKRRATSSSSSTGNLSKEAGNKLKDSNFLHSEEEIHGMNKDNIPDSLSNRRTSSRSRLHVTQKLQSQNENIFESRNDFGISNSAYRAKNVANVYNIETELKNGGLSVRAESTSSDEKVPLDFSTEGTSTKRSNKFKSVSHLSGTKMHRSSKSMVKASIEQSCSDMERNGQFADDSNVGKLRDTVPAQGGNGVSSMGLLKMIGLMRSSKPDRPERAEVTSNRHKKIKMLFPYEEFVKFFQSDFFNLSPRGFVNCGNSCYANAVLQCLTCTKPLIIFLLRRSHSRACCAKDWCLLCELEQHATMLTESGGPLSPSRILSHMRSINCQIGDGSQEDAHEFLRFLITSMQSICLEGLGGENMVDARLQETTFIQHTFGGHLRSKVKCLRCFHESERCESIMDLTLEIFGWVESLEDALTQFTSAEDLDGENMYRCGRCAAYVRARKQLCIQEAPNILTIVLKRFQEGSYGKINKCITFPEMLDMVPFMTGTDDIPPLYILYAVVVHLDTLNASFSGHYVSYVKDLQGSWFRIDDTEVQPVQMSQVMSEGAYILFYMRSCPRPARAYTEKPIRLQAPGFPKHWSSKTHKSPRSGQSKSGGYFVDSEHSIDRKPEMPMRFTNHPSSGIFCSSNRNRPPFVESYAKSTNMEFSDAASSDWSIFTSSDDASFTTESTRDSFSTVDYADAGNMDPIASIFNTFYTPDYSSSHKTVSCSRFYSSKPQAGFVSEENGRVWDSFLSTQPHDRLQKGENRKQDSVPSFEALPFVYLENEDNPIDAPSQNFWPL